MWKSVGIGLTRLANGSDNRVRSMNTINFILKEEVPRCRKVTYANFVCYYFTLKSEPFRVRLTVRGDRLEYPENVASPSESLLESKVLFNITISDAHRCASFISCDLKDFSSKEQQQQEHNI